MSASAEGPLSPEEQRAALSLLEELAALVYSDPRSAAARVTPVLPVLRERFPDTTAYGWALHLKAQACRFADDLPGVLEATDAGDDAFGPDGQFTAQLHLEAGMSLNQFGKQPDALDHLRRSASAFELRGDRSGEAWALVAMAEALAGVGYPEDPLPLLTRAIASAQHAGDEVALRRAYKQQAVALRHRGRVSEALESIRMALEGQPEGHSRANFQLERGHLLAMAGQYAAADEDYLAAEAVYAETGDLLGLGNCARALATSALILGRNAAGLRHLDVATKAYRRLSNESGLGYALRERALVRLADNDDDGATADAAEGIRAFRRSGDRLGLAGMLRNAARIAHVRGDDESADELLDEASRLVTDNSNPLAEAGVLLTRAEIDQSAPQRLAAARRAASLYERMRVGPGRAHALVLQARAQLDGDDPSSALQTLVEARDAWIGARIAVADPARRADHDFALRDVVTTALNTADVIGSAGAREFAADLLLFDAPLGLRRILRTGDVGTRARTVIERAKTSGVPRRGDARRSLLGQLSHALSTLEGDAGRDLVTFEQLCDDHPDAAVLVIGSPTRDSKLPVAWAVPSGLPSFRLHPLDAAHVDAIDALGLASAHIRTGVLWQPAARTWQTSLAEPMVPAELAAWLKAHSPAELVAVLPPVLSHVPVEALLLDGEPLGVLAAVRRIPVLSAGTSRTIIDEITAYLDPALPWTLERNYCPDAASDPAALVAGLGERRLIVAGCHGESATRAEGTLYASDGTPVVDALDLLGKSLRHSVVVLEACFSGRYYGARTGDQLNLATVALLAGASEVIGGLVALPASDATTGQIAGVALRELRDGAPAPEALRRARAEYLAGAASVVPLPAADDAKARTMPPDAPWAWAGLCSYGR